MKKIRILTALLCAAAATAAMGFTSLAENEGSQLQPVSMDGTIASVESDRFTMNWNQEGGTMQAVIMVSDSTRILDAVNGYPVSLSDLGEGGRVRVYADQAMTLSLPPMTNGEIVLTDIPEDFRIPSYETVASLVKNQDGTSTVTAVSGASYQVESSTALLPYLTRNIVTVDDLSPGVTFLAWTSGDGSVNKIVIFPQMSIDSSLRQGWTETQDGWYFYEAGEMKTGWLLDGDDWYYLNPETGLMATGFIKVDGKTYYMTEDGRMLKEARVFTPDENGALH